MGTRFARAAPVPEPVANPSLVHTPTLVGALGILLRTDEKKAADFIAVSIYMVSIVSCNRNYADVTMPMAPKDSPWSITPCIAI